jgi:hypothetical protein
VETVTTDGHNVDESIVLVVFHYLPPLCFGKRCRTPLTLRRVTEIEYSLDLLFAQRTEVPGLKIWFRVIASMVGEEGIPFE